MSDEHSLPATSAMLEAAKERANAGEPILSLETIHAGYGPTRVLEGVSISVPAGALVGLIGPNGAGKTTLLRTICGQTTVESGEIKLQGRPIQGLRTSEIARLGVAHVVEGRGMLRGMSVVDNLLLGAYGRPGNMQERLREVYSLFPRLQERAHQRAETLSGGEQQMLAIGRGLMMDPVVMLLDEPSQGLSPLLVDTVIDSVRDVSERGVTIVIVEQSPSLLIRLVDEVHFVASGRVSDGMPVRVLEDADVVGKVLAQGVLPS